MADGGTRDGVKTRSYVRVTLAGRESLGRGTTATEYGHTRVCSYITIYTYIRTLIRVTCTWALSHVTLLARVYRTLARPAPRTWPSTYFSGQRGRKELARRGRVSSRSPTPSRMTRYVHGRAHTLARTRGASLRQHDGEGVCSKEASVN